MATTEDTHVLQKGSDALIDYCCSVCEDNDTLSEAHSYCESCSKWYCDQCVSLHGQMYRKHTPLGRSEQEKWPVAKGVAELLSQCEDHKGENIKMFCADHSQLCCTTCLLLDHRQCKKVTQLTSGDHKKKHKDLQKLATDINNLTQRLRKLLEKKECNVKSLQCAFDKILEEIALMRQKLNAALDLLEQRTINKGKALVNRLQESLQADVNSGKSAMKRILSLQEASDKIGPQNLELSTVAFLKIQKELVISESILRAVKPDSTLSFNLNTEIESLLAKMTTLATFNTSNKSTAIITTGKSHYNVELSGETECGISGICEIANGNIILADRFNNKMKMLDKDYRVISHCDMPANPRYVCQIADAEVAVAVCDWGSFHEIHVLAMTNNNLVKKRTLKLTHPCSGIYHNNGHLYVTSDTALYRYSMAGVLLNKLYEDNSGLLTVYRCAVNASGTRIYVVNYSNHKVLTLDMKGQLLSSFTDPELKHPIDVHVTESGQVLVCGETSMNIIQLNTEGTEKIGTVASLQDTISVEEGNYVVSICMLKRTCSLLVGINTSSNIVVFDTK